MTTQNTSSESSDGPSKKMGIILTVTMILALIAIGGSAYITVNDDPQPNAEFTIRVENDTATVVHVAGGPVSGDRIHVVGVENGRTAFDGQTLRWGERGSFTITDYPIEVIYQPESGGNYTMAVAHQ